MMGIPLYDGFVSYEAHNREVDEVWKSYKQGIPHRIPMILGIGSRYFLLSKGWGIPQVSYREYSEDPDVMFECQVRFDYMKKMYIPADHRMGLPEEGWAVVIDFQNYFEAAWFGSEIKYIEHNVPAAEPFLDEEHKNILFCKGIPDAFSGLMAKGREYYEHFHSKAQKYMFKGVQVKHIIPGFTYTDGPFTVACNIRGATQFCLDLYDDAQYAHQLLDYITQATLYRLKEWRKYMGQPEVQDSINFADDSILLLSEAMYKEFVLPYHKRIIEGLCHGEHSHSVHLCGDATRHFKTLVHELNVRSFDTGFPVKHGELVKQLGPDVEILGGPHVEYIQTQSPEQILNETRRIIDEVKPHTKKFILREGNNLSPGTPVKNTTAMYEACRKYGEYLY